MVKIDKPATWVFSEKTNYKPNDNIFKLLKCYTAKKQKIFNRENKSFQQYSKEFNPNFPKQILIFLEQSQRVCLKTAYLKLI